MARTKELQDLMDALDNNQMKLLIKYMDTVIETMKEDK